MLSVDVHGRVGAVVWAVVRDEALFENCNEKYPKLTFYATKYVMKYGSTVITFKGKNAADNFKTAKALIGKWASK